MSTGSLERQARVARAAQDAEPALSEADADSQGYTLSVVDIRTRTTLGHAKTLKLLGDGAIPGVRVVSNRAKWQWRVRPEDLEAACAHLPADPIPSIQAVEVLAGRRVKALSETYNRLMERLARSVRRGDLVAYDVFGSARYSRAELVAFKEAEGIRPAAIQNRYADLRQRHAAAGLVGAAEAASMCEVHQATVYGWAKKGLYGATKICGALFFDREQLAARKRAPYKRSEKVTCAGDGCNEVVERRASILRRSAERGEKDGRHEGRAYCPSCLPAMQEEWRAMGPKAIRDTDVTTKWRKAQVKAYERVPDRPEQKEAIRKYMADLRRQSENQYVEHFARMQRGRGTALTPETEAALKSRSRSCARKGRAGRKPAADLPSHYAEWALMLDDVRDYYERQACTGEPMPSDWELFLAVAMEDQQNHSERWTYDPMDLPRNAADRVAKAIKKYLQITQNEIALNGST